MRLSAGLKVGNYIYLLESISRCLISIHMPSREAKVETYLPWKYTDNKIGMFSLNHNIFIYSPALDHFLVYDCLKHQVTTIKLQESEADERGFYCSNVLVDQEEFIILPFKGTEIKRYEMNGKLKFKDNQWLFDVFKECGNIKSLFGNIRMNSACVSGSQLYFSLIYGNKNYLCKYELDGKTHTCKVVYYSEDVPIRGVYAYSNMVLFRRIFSDKTEIVSITLDSEEEKKTIIDYPAMFEEDIYGDICDLKGAFKNQILAIEWNNLKAYQKIYNFGQSDIYITNGILFNTLKNEILMPDVNCLRKYSIEKIIWEIENSISYLEGCKKIFEKKYVGEEKAMLQDLITYVIKQPFVELKKKRLIEDGYIGKLIFERLYDC